MRDAALEGGEVRFDFEGDDASLADLVARAVSQGVALCELRLEKADLEDIFLRTTQGKLQ